jgi:hypothetical protein
VTPILVPVSAEVRARLAADANRELPLEEWKAQLAIPLSPEEIENNRALVRWFCRRYPTAAERLAYARRAYARWMRSAGGNQASLGLRGSF